MKMTLTMKLQQAHGTMTTMTTNLCSPVVPMEREDHIFGYICSYMRALSAMIMFKLYQNRVHQKTCSRYEVSG